MLKKSERGHAGHGCVFTLLMLILICAYPPIAIVAGIILLIVWPRSGC